MVSTASRTERTTSWPSEVPAGSAPQSRRTIVFNGRVFSTPFSDLMPPLTTDEEDALFADIVTRGVVTPVVVTERNDVIDGHHRLRLAVALEIKEIPIKCVAGLTEQEAQQLAISLNVHRRHLDQEQRRDLIAQILKATPQKSNSSVAAVIKADRKTVESVRQKLESTGEIPRLEETQGKDGKSRPRRINKQPPAGTTTLDLMAPSHPEAVAPDASGLDSEQPIEATDQKPGESGIQVGDALVKSKAKNQLWAIGNALTHLGGEIRSASEEGTWTRTRLQGYVNKIREEATKLKTLIES